jgi:hypothetical protein
MRVASTLFVLLYHSALSYQSHPMRLTLWPQYDAHNHVGMDLFALWVNGFAMPFFFLSAGISAPAAVESRGPWVFLSHRAGRLLRPMLFGCVTILPVIYLLTGLGLLVTGRCSLDNMANWRFPPEVDRHLYGLGHLWFLEYLFLICALWAMLWWFQKKSDCYVPASWSSGLKSGLEQAVGSAWKPALLAVPTALVFLVDTDTLLRVENILTPNFSRVVHYLYFFSVGGWIARIPAAKERLSAHGRLYLTLAALDFVVMAPLLLQFAWAPLHGGERVVLGVLAALFPWLFIFGLLATLLRREAGKSPALRFLSESSFWVYIVHLPIVLLAQILLLSFVWPALAKLLVVSTVTVALSLLSYEYTVRYTIVGEIINGARKRWKAGSRLSPNTGLIVMLTTVLFVAAGSVWYLHVFLWKDNFFVVQPGQLYRSARISTAKLDRTLVEQNIRTVIVFSGGGHPWIEEQQRACRERGATLHVVNMRGDRLPSRQTLLVLIDLLERAPGPILVEAYRGLDHCGFTSALAEMLEGMSPDAALEQFGSRYAQFGGPENSALGATLLAYRDWLRIHDLKHTPARIRTWAEHEYLASSMPTLPAAIQAELQSVAEAQRASTLR